MVQKADVILNNAVFKGSVPDEFTFCLLIYGLCEDGDIDRAKNLFQEDNKWESLNLNVLNLDTKMTKNMSKNYIIDSIYNANSVYLKPNFNSLGNSSLNNLNTSIYTKEPVNNNNNNSESTNGNNSTDKRFKTLPIAKTLLKNEDIGFSMEYINPSGQEMLVPHALFSLLSSIFIYELVIPGVSIGMTSIMMTNVDISNNGETTDVSAIPPPDVNEVEWKFLVDYFSSDGFKDKVKDVIAEKDQEIEEDTDMDPIINAAFVEVVGEKSKYILGQGS
ncbi:hypothetical protein CQW23_31187 [Capsicum baccatum]|uniref:Uncharacterized protein n=1 Tax=Capsicum baccatum TaxID=33114 RepID=A0A2G2V8A6_CAPBA|nr:hypothetical protein CQW23_31187 [Capsicum baccatum]